MALWFTGELLASTEHNRKEKIAKCSSLLFTARHHSSKQSWEELNSFQIWNIDDQCLLSIEDVPVFPGQKTVFNSLSFGDFNLF